MTELICKNCKKSFIPFYDYQTTCSRNCSVEFSQKKFKAKNPDYWKTYKRPKTPKSNIQEIKMVKHLMIIRTKTENAYELTKANREIEILDDEIEYTVKEQIQPIMHKYNSTSEYPPEVRAKFSGKKEKFHGPHGKRVVDYITEFLKQREPEIIPKNPIIKYASDAGYAITTVSNALSLLVKEGHVIFIRGEGYHLKNRKIISIKT